MFLFHACDSCILSGCIWIRIFPRNYTGEEIITCVVSPFLLLKCFLLFMSPLLSLVILFGNNYSLLYLHSFLFSTYTLILIHIMCVFTFFFQICHFSLCSGKASHASGPHHCFDFPQQWISTPRSNGNFIFVANL